MESGRTSISVPISGLETIDQVEQFQQMLDRIGEIHEYDLVVDRTGSGAVVITPNPSPIYRRRGSHDAVVVNNRITMLVAEALCATLDIKVGPLVR